MRAIRAMTPHEAAMTLEWVTGEFMLRWLERVPGVTIERFGGRAPPAPGRPGAGAPHRRALRGRRGASVARADAGAGLRTPGGRATRGRGASGRLPGRVRARAAQDAVKLCAGHRHPAAAARY